MDRDDEKHGRGDGHVREALRMVEAFASVGVKTFDLTHTNVNHEKRGFRPRQSVAQISTSLPYLVPSSFRRQNNVILRPHDPPAVFLVQLDDLNAGKLAPLGDAVFLILETSPGNFQAWVAVERAGKPADADFARRLRKGAGADPTASGATRTAGTANYKPKYAPSFPVVRIEAVYPGRIVARPALEAKKGLVAASAPVAASSGPANRRARGVWPSYQHCLMNAPKAHGSAERIDVSRADFTWCVTAIDWGWSVEDVASRLLQESPKARESGQAYAVLTATNAAAAVEHRSRPSHDVAP